MGAQECSPRGGPIRCRSYAVVLQHLADRACRHPMPTLPQFALNAAIAPAVVLTSQADNEGRDHLPHPRPTDASGRVGPLPGDQTPMPTHQRIRGDEGGNRVQRPSPEALGLHRQSTTLIVGQPKLPATQLLFEDPVLLDQVGDNILLMPMHPAGNRQQQQLERESRGRHPAIVGALKSHVWRAVTDRSIFRTGRAVRCPRVRADRSPADRAAVPPASAPLRRKRAVAHDVEAQFSTVVTPALGAGHPVDRVHRSSVPGGNPRFSPKISEVKATDQQRPAQAPRCDSFASC